MVFQPAKWILTTKRMPALTMRVCPGVGRTGVYQSAQSTLAMLTGKKLRLRQFGMSAAVSNSTGSNDRVCAAYSGCLLWVILSDRGMFLDRSHCGSGIVRRHRFADRSRPVGRHTAPFSSGLSVVRGSVGPDGASPGKSRVPDGRARQDRWRLAKPEH
jgi:hypothetical protein